MLSTQRHSRGLTFINQEYLQHCGDFPFWFSGISCDRCRFQLQSTHPKEWRMDLGLIMVYGLRINSDPWILFNTTLYRDSRDPKRAVRERQLKYEVVATPSHLCDVFCTAQGNRRRRMELHGPGTEERPTGSRDNIPCVCGARFRNGGQQGPVVAGRHLLMMTLPLLGKLLTLIGHLATVT